MSARAWAQLRFLRPALYGILVLDVIAVGLFAIRVQTVTRTTTIPTAQLSTPVTVPSAVPVVAAGTPIALPAGPALSTGGGTTVTLPGEPGASSTPTSPATPSGPPVTGDGSSQIGECPIPLAKPTRLGGLQTLIGFAPAFGPFKDEAFAAASAYQPVLQLLGPILAKYPEIAPKIEPAMAPFLDAFAGLLDQGYTLLAPLYGPYRQQVLTAESKLADALAPYSQKLVTSPLGGCVIDLEAALVGDTTQGAAKVAAAR